MSDLEQQASTWVPPWQRPAPEPESDPAGATSVTEVDLADDADGVRAPAAAEGTTDHAATARTATADRGTADDSDTVDDSDTADDNDPAGGAASAGDAADGAAAGGPVGVGGAKDGAAAGGPVGVGGAKDGAAAGGLAGVGGTKDSGATRGGVAGTDAAPVAGGVPRARAGAGEAEAGDAGEADEVPDLAAAAGAMLAQSLAEVDAAAAEAKAAKRAEEKAGKAERQRKAKAKPVAVEAPAGDGDDAKASLGLEPLPPLTEAEIAPVLEAILLVVDEPVSEITLSQVLEIPAEEIAGVLIDLSARYSAEARGFDLRRAAGGWRFYTRTDYSSYVERFVLDGQQLRLTQASLETLAVVAYKQPVTRSRISAIRGVNCDGVIRTLVTRGMVEECGTDAESGAHLYRTTTLFLEKMGLDSVEQLPPLAPFLPDNLEELAAHE
jgi:segregation and condensation protein B